MDFLKTLLPDKVDLSTVRGKWRGHYEQQGDEYRIEVSFEQSDTKISGSMKDLDREQRFNLMDFAERFPMSDEERKDYVAKIALPFGNPPPHEIFIVQVLPEKSDLIGAIVDDGIYFQKLYRTPTTNRVEHGRRRWESQSPSEPIHYEGKLSDDRLRIAGNWTFENSDGDVLGEGRFELIRR